MKPVRAYLVLEDGSIFEGEARGAFREMACEVVFNTSMTGYLEILTDPSYAGQGVVMTYPMIGNYGVSREDFESIRLQPCAFFLHELCDTPSNFRSTASLESVLKEFDIPCIVGLDTRAIVKKLRESGTMRGMMTGDLSNMKHCMDVIRDFRQVDLVESVSITKPEVVGAGNTGPKIALMDFGVKRNIARSLASRGCEVTVYPCFATAAEIIAAKPDGLMLGSHFHQYGYPDVGIDFLQLVHQGFFADVLHAYVEGGYDVTTVYRGKVYDIQVFIHHLLTVGNTVPSFQQGVEGQFNAVTGSHGCIGIETAQGLGCQRTERLFTLVVYLFVEPASVLVHLEYG